PPRPTLFPYTTLFRSAIPSCANLLADHTHGADARARSDLRTVPDHHPLLDDYVLADLRRRMNDRGSMHSAGYGICRRKQLGHSGDRKSTRLNSSHVAI